MNAKTQPSDDLLAHQNRMRHAITMFGTAADLARAINVHRAQVFRWEQGDRDMLIHHQQAIMLAGKARDMDLEELAWAIDVQRCPCCGCVLDEMIRDMMPEPRQKKRARG